MTTLTLETDPLASVVSIGDEKLVVHLIDGRSLAVPLDWYPRLLHASASERQNWLMLGDGYAIEWPLSFNGRAGSGHRVLPANDVVRDRKRRQVAALQTPRPVGYGT
ncbi:MAG TPA: DUF2442 domain-containing protein [Planctomycetaceae bacterium]|nr:DUF2442 domain-containing protein [Planctomycetaceae bacterium]